MNKNYNLHLDLQIRPNNIPTMEFDIFDNNTSDFFIQVTNDGELVDIEDAMVVLAAIKPSGYADIQFIEIQDNSIYGNLKHSMKDETGDYTASAMLILNDKTTTLNDISYRVNQNQVFSTINKVVRSDERFTLLTDMLSRLSGIELSEKQRQDNEATRETEFKNKINILDSKIAKIDSVDNLKNEAGEILKEFNDRIGDASKIATSITYGNSQQVIECVNNKIILPGDLYNINVKDYISLTTVEANNEITWDDAFQKAFNDLNDGGILIIPEGTYCIKNRAILQNKEGITISCAGVIKPLSGQTAKIGTLTIRNVNNATINGLTFNGNRNGVTPPSTFGIESLINIDNCTNIVFNNLVAFDVSSIMLNSNEGLDNIIFNNIYTRDIGEHVLYLGGNGSSNIKINNLYCENIGICSVNANRSVSVIKLRNKAAGDRLHDNIVVDGFYFKNTVINTNNDRQLIQAFDTKNVSIKNGQVIGEDTSIFATNISIDSLICENVIFDGRRIVHGINKNYGYDNATVINTPGKFKIRFLNCELKGKNDYSTDISLYSNCIINTKNQHYTSSMSTNINNEVVFDRCKISTDGVDGRLNFIFDNDILNRLEFSNIEFCGYTGTTQPLIISNVKSGRTGTVNVIFSDVEVEEDLKNFYQGDSTVNLTVRDSYINGTITNNNNNKFKYLNISNTRIKTYSNLDTLTSLLSVNNVMHINGSRKDLKIFRQICNYGQANIIDSKYQRVGVIKREHLLITNDDFCKFTCDINDKNEIVITPTQPAGSTSSSTTFTVIYQFQNGI